MHLHDLLQKANRHITASEGVEVARQSVGGEPFMGLLLPAKTDSRIVLKGASEFAHILGSEDAGFMAGLVGDKLIGRASASVVVSFESEGQRISRTTEVEGKLHTRVLLPNALDLPDPFAPLDLTIEVEQPSAKLFLGSSMRTPRDALYRMAKGVGVEIGPGPRPQIHNGPDVEVTYVEEMPAEAWTALYNEGVSREAWEQQGYRIGKAHELPVEDGSLDFIFSSHVIEHLYNPLGHFDHWRKKLKPGGLVLGVIPSTEGTKDFVLPRTSIVDLIHEHEQGGFSAPLPAFVHWVQHHQPHHADIEAAARKYMEDGFSIHVHVYDQSSFTALLQRCKEAHGYSAYRMFYRKNAKDFVFALKA